MSSELFNSTLSRDLDLITFERLLFALTCSLIFVEFILIIRTEEADQRIEVVKLILLLGVAQLFRVDLHCRVDLHNFVQEILDLLLLPLKLAILLV